MKLLFEEYPYKTGDIKNVLGDFLLSDLDKEQDTQSLKCVGYFFNKGIENPDGSVGDLVFILPKVLLDENGKAFGLDPMDILNFNFENWKKNELVVPDGNLTKLEVYNFIYGFVVWIYRAVSLYRNNLRLKQSKDNEDDVKQGVMTSLEIGRSGKKKDATFLDVLLSLLDFQRTHKDFITYAINISHSGFNKISWTKTISRTQAIIQDGTPVYLNPLNKKKIINFDEELLIIYFSILNYMHDEYGFPIPNQPGYKLIKGAMFRSYLKSQGITRLHKIRYKYYSDSAVLLWNLCYAFFEMSDNLKANANKKDYLLVNKFETVFEGMIDELIGDKDLPEHLKAGADDKRIDHLYTYKYLIENLGDNDDLPMTEKTYNIADSKYYRRDRGLGGHDVPKQFTYARNVIQWHMDLLNDLIPDAKAKEFKDIPLFDEVTEGYNIIPNFFISALVNENLNYDIDNFAQSTLKDKSCQESFFFWERLFDRSSLFTLHYDVNFLYVLKMYAKNKSYDKTKWKNEVRNKFRKEMLEYLNGEFDFYQVLIPSDLIAEFVEKHYRKLAGRVFSFYDENNVHILIYAERKNLRIDNKHGFEFDDSKHPHIKNGSLVIPDANGEHIYRVNNIKLGGSSYNNPHIYVYLPGVEYEINREDNHLSPVTPNILMEVPSEEYVLVGYYRTKEQLGWIHTNAMYNIPAKRRSSNVKMKESEIFAKYLILFNETFGTYVYNVKPSLPYLMSNEEMPNSDGYVPGHDYYMIYELEMNSNVDSIIIHSLIKSNYFVDYSKKTPLAFKMSSLRKYAENTPNYSVEDEDVFMSMVAEDFLQYNSKKKDL